MFEPLLSRCAISIYIAALMFEAFSVPLALACLPHPAAVLFLTLQNILLFVPLRDPAPRWASQLLKYSMSSYAKWSRLRLIFEDGASPFDSLKTPCVIGYEPHSVLPFGIAPTFTKFQAVKLKMGRVRILATSAIDWCPIVRHLFFWFGGRPASSNSMHKLLSEGSSVIVVPGGVAECAYMSHKRDVVFLKSRKGFTRIALQHGVPLVPVFCFGQNEVYRFVKLGPPVIPQWLVDKFVRTILFCPMLIYGYLGTPLPFKVKLTMVIGKPIVLPKLEEPSPEEVQQHLDLFISRMQKLYDEHKADAGYPDSQLIVM